MEPCLQQMCHISDQISFTHVGCQANNTLKRVDAHCLLLDVQSPGHHLRSGGRLPRIQLVRFSLMCWITLMRQKWKGVRGQAQVLLQLPHHHQASLGIVFSIVAARLGPLFDMGTYAHNKWGIYAHTQKQKRFGGREAFFQ